MDVIRCPTTCRPGQSFANPKLVVFGASPLASLLIRKIHQQIQLTGHNSTVFTLHNSCQVFFVYPIFSHEKP
jgi:hypothetical protein